MEGMRRGRRQARREAGDRSGLAVSSELARIARALRFDARL